MYRPPLTLYWEACASLRGFPAPCTSLRVFPAPCTSLRVFPAFVLSWAQILASLCSLCTPLEKTSWSQPLHLWYSLYSKWTLVTTLIVQVTSRANSLFRTMPQVLILVASMSLCLQLPLSQVAYRWLAYDCMRHHVQPSTAEGSNGGQREKQEHSYPSPPRLVSAQRFSKHQCIVTITTVKSDSLCAIPDALLDLQLCRAV